MIKTNKTKNSQFAVYIGWALRFYCDNDNDVNHLKRMYGLQVQKINKINKEKKNGTSND